MPPPTRQPAARTFRADLDDAELMARVWEVEVASRRHQRPWADSESVAAFTLDHRNVDRGQHHELWVATDGDQVAGLASAWLHLGDNTDKVFAEVHVHPEHRGRGLGTALIDDLVRVARANGRTEVLGETLVPLDANEEHPYLHFARSRGAEVTSRDSMHHLVLPVPDDLLAALEADARGVRGDRYRLRTYVGGVPDDLQDSLCQTENQLIVDAPGGSVDYEPESLTTARYRETLGLFAAQGRRCWTTVALDCDDQVVAYTDLVIGAGTRRTVWQWGTLVRREHRGHRLGLAVKVQNLRRVQVEHPERTLVVTGNDDDNSPMRTINEALGFLPAEGCPQLRLRW